MSLATGRRHRASVGLTVAVLAWGALCTSTAWAAAPAIPPGREADILALFAPLQDEGPVGEDVTLSGVRVGGHAIVVTLRHVSGATTQVTLTPVDDAVALGRAFHVRAASTDHTALQAAQKAVMAAVKSNDKGVFFRAGGAVRVVGTAGRADFELWASPEAWLSAALWLLLLVVLVHPVLGLARRAVLGPRRVQALGWLGGGLSLLLVAVAVRRHLPFTPLHANDHAWEDLAVVLGLPEATLSIARHAETYGTGWLVARRALNAVFGAHIAGVGAAATWWGGGAVLLSALAARAAGGTGLAVAVATLAAVWAPAGARVAHSESGLVVAQWLLAAGLWSATRPGRVGVVGAAAACALLALGHAVGPAFAAGLAAMAFAVRPAQRPRPPRAAAATDEPQAPGAAPSVARARLRTAAAEARHRAAQQTEDRLLPAARPGAPFPWRLAAGLIVAVGAATALRLLHAGAHVGGRLARIEQTIPIPNQPLKFSVWASPAYAPTALWALAALGVCASLWARWRGERWRGLVLEAPLALGATVVFVAGLLVCASITDGLRYQATLLAPSVVLAARAGLGWRHGPARWRWALGVLQGVATVGVLVALLQGFPGSAHLDGQAQAWQALQANLGPQRGTLTLIRPGRHPASPAVPDVPQGPWSATGPTTVAMDAAAALVACKSGAGLPEATYVVESPACHARAAEGAAAGGVDASGAARAAAGRPCGEALALRAKGPALAARQIELARPLTALGLPGEFLRFPHGQVPWRLYRAACPGAPGEARAPH